MNIKDLASLNEGMNKIKKMIIEDLYQAELDEDLKYEKSAKRPKNSANYRNGNYRKLVKSSTGNIELLVPRDRQGKYEPQIVKKHQMDISNIEEKIIGLFAAGMSNRDISDNIKDLYSLEVSPQTITNITDRVLPKAREWQSRMLKTTYAVVFMDGMVFKVKKDGIIQKCTVYACIGIDLDGQKEVLSLHQGALESAKYWLNVMNDLKSRGVKDVLIFCRDNLSGISEAIKACFPNSDHQKCIIHQIRNSLKHVSAKDLKEVCEDLKTIYKAPNVETGYQNLQEFDKKWKAKYMYIAKSWLENWETLSTFWSYPPEIRQLIYTTNPIESFNRGLRKVTKNRPSFPDEDALLKSLYLGIVNIEKKWTSKVRNWGIIYSQLQILFNDRVIKFEL